MGEVELHFRFVRNGRQQANPCPLSNYFIQ
jgi:hypothetical protein